MAILLLEVRARSRGLLSGLLTGNADDLNVLNTHFKRAPLIEQVATIATAFALAEESTDAGSRRILLDWTCKVLDAYDEETAGTAFLPLDRLWNGANDRLLELANGTVDPAKLCALTLAADSLVEHLHERASL